MLKKILKFLQISLLWVTILSIGFSLTVKSAHAQTAQTSKATKSSAAAKTPVESVASPDPKTVAKMKFTAPPSGLHRANTYVAGQSIKITVSLSGQPTSVWAETGVLDPNFEANSYFQNEGAGNWQLQTPKLSDDLNVGSHILNIKAQNAAGKIIKTSVKITLKQFTAVAVSNYKVSSDGSASITWQRVDFADVYLVSWQVQGDSESAESLQTKKYSVKITDLEPGTFYEVKIQPLRGDAVGLAALIVFKTLGETLTKAVAGIQAPVTPPPITPQITPQAAATQKVAAISPTPSATAKTQEETVSPTPSPTPSASPSPTESAQATATAGGWNKLLVALSILIIAAGAAIGGYYGYEWLMVKSKDKEEQPPKSGNRW